jgi:hypothetical protein
VEANATTQFEIIPIRKRIGVPKEIINTEFDA